MGVLTTTIRYESLQNIKNSFVVTYLMNNRLQLFSVIYMVVSIILAFIGPLIVPHSPTTPDPRAQLLSPSSDYWFGTDVNGMCIFSRTIAAFRTDLFISLCGALLALIVGAPVGVFAGFFDGRGGGYGFLSMVILRIMDIIQAFPIFVLGLLLVAGFGPNPLNLIFLIGITNLPPNLRLARSEVLSLREKSFVEAARAAGNKELRIAFSHTMPNALTPVIALLSMVMGFGILLTAGLSFVGAGVRVPTPEWGSMIAIGASSMITGHWWPAFFPGLVMGLTIFAFSMIGQAITSLLDPLERVKLGFSR
jgi:peptide/nickel transport system permease protein